MRILWIASLLLAATPVAAADTSVCVPVVGAFACVIDQGAGGCASPEDAGSGRDAVIAAAPGAAVSAGGASWCDGSIYRQTMDVSVGTSVARAHVWYFHQDGEHWAWGNCYYAVMAQGPVVGKTTQVRCEDVGVAPLGDMGWGRVLP